MILLYGLERKNERNDKNVKKIRKDIYLQGMMAVLQSLKEG